MVFRRPLSLREAAATIFALSAVLPLLVVLFLLVRSRLLTETAMQVGLLLALVIALLGFALTRQLVVQVSTVAKTLAAAEPAEEPAARPAGPSPVPGLGPVTELGEIMTAFGRLMEEVRRSTVRLSELGAKVETLNEIVEVAVGVPTAAERLGLILERTMRTVGATIGSIMLLDRARQSLRIAASRGLPDDIVAAAEVRLGEGIAGKVAVLGEPVLVDDIETDSRFGRANNPKYGSGSFISMPVQVGDRVIGVLNLAKKASAEGVLPGARSFSLVDFQFLNTLRPYIALTVDHARLLEAATPQAE